TVVVTIASTPSTATLTAPRRSPLRGTRAPAGAACQQPVRGDERCEHAKRPKDGPVQPRGGSNEEGEHPRAGVRSRLQCRSQSVLRSAVVREIACKATVRTRFIAVATHSGHIDPWNEA